MVEVSSPGRASPKIKSIDVEANLLAERIAERERLLDALSRKSLAALGVFVFALLVLPAAYRLQAKAYAKAIAATLAETRLAKQLADRSAILKAEKPKIEDTQMLETTRRYSLNFLTQTSAFLGLAGPRMVFSSLKGEVIGGDLKLGARADAESYDVAREYVDSVAKVARTKSTMLKGWKQSDSFALGGCEFEVEMVSEVGK